MRPCAVRACARFSAPARATVGLVCLCAYLCPRLWLPRGCCAVRCAPGVLVCRVCRVCVYLCGGARLPLLRPVRPCLFCSTVPGVPGVYLVLLSTALLPLLCRDPESPGTAPTLATCNAGALHAALLYASVTIIFYA